MKAVRCSFRAAAVVIALATAGRAQEVYGPAPGAPPPGAIAIEARANALVGPVGTLFLAGVEFGGARNSSLEVSIGGYNYDYWDGSCNECGSGTVMGVIGRFYQQPGLVGMYYGAGLAYIDGEFDWYDSPLRGWGTVSGTAPAVTCGYKYVAPGSNVTVEPNLLFAYLLDPGDADLTVILAAGCAVGLKF